MPCSASSTGYWHGRRTANDTAPPSPTTTGCGGAAIESGPAAQSAWSCSEEGVAGEPMAAHAAAVLPRASSSWYAATRTLGSPVAKGRPASESVGDRPGEVALLQSAEL